MDLQILWNLLPRRCLVLLTVILVLVWTSSGSSWSSYDLLAASCDTVTTSSSPSPEGNLNSALPRLSLLTRRRRRRRRTGRQPCDLSDILTGTELSEQSQLGGGWCQAYALLSSRVATILSIFLVHLCLSFSKSYIFLFLPWYSPAIYYINVLCLLHTSVLNIATL